MKFSTSCPYNPCLMSTRSCRGHYRRVAIGTLLALVAAAPSFGQALRGEPMVFGAGRITLGGDASLTLSCAETPAPGNCGEDTGFFNYSDYQHSTMRLLTLDVSASVRASQQFTLLAELRSENGGTPQLYALYVRFRPWKRRAFDLQAGRVPPTFGAFARRTYASDNLLIGYPLAYQYLTSLRPDATPASADDLIKMRGRGWLSSFPIGSTTPDRGLPLATAFRWDTGIQAHTASRWADATVAVTTGSLTNPLFGDDNGGKQIVGRVAVHPVPGLLMGVSGARGQFLTRGVLRSAGREADAGRFVQRAWGADAEYSRDYYLVRFETIVSDWTVPALETPLRAAGTALEGRYKLRPGLYAAARLDHLGFSQVTGTTRTTDWDAPVTRVEVGGGYLLRRNLQLKLSVQRNVRDGGRVPRLTLGAAQLGFWF